MSYILHHLARLEMMTAEEKGEDLSYEQALEIVEKKSLKKSCLFEN